MLTRDELSDVVANNAQSHNSYQEIMSAVDAYAEALIAAKPLVSRRWSDAEKRSLEQYLFNEASDTTDDYENAAEYLNQQFGNNRTAAACRGMDYRMHNGG